MTHRVHLKVFKANFLHLVVGRVIHQTSDVTPESVPLFQLRWIAVGDACQMIQLVTGDAAQLSNVGLKMGKDLGIHVHRQRGPQTGVDVIEIQARTIWRDVTVVRPCGVGVGLALGRGLEMQLRREV